MGEVYQSILEEHFIETLDASKIWIFQDDNARPHQTAAVEQFKEDNLFLGLHKGNQPYYYRKFLG